MYAEQNRDNPLVSFWHHQHSELPSELSTEEDGIAMSLFGLPEFHYRDRLPSQQSSRASSPRIKAASLPDPFFFSPSPQEKESDASIALSPAAMFLSAFSPPPTAKQSLPDDEGETVAGYTLGPIIGHGGFSTIRRASSHQGGTVAVKIVRRSDLQKSEDPELAKRHLLHEAAVWTSLSHEHVLPLFNASHTSYADFFVTLYCPGGSLFDVLKRDGRPALPPDDAGRMFRQVVKGLRYLHEVAGYVHGDMKLENVLIDEMGVCRIGDFGMARKIGGCDTVSDCEDESPTRGANLRATQSLRQPKRSRSRHKALPIHLSLLRHHSGPRHRNSSPLPIAPPPADQVVQPGSLPYASPELLLPNTGMKQYRTNPAQDIWALGAMLYALFTGRLPFMDAFEPRLQMKILHGAYDMPDGIGRCTQRVLQGCLERAVPDRWTIAMVDEIAWGIGLGDEHEDTILPADIMSSRSRSHSRPAPLPEHAIMEDAEFCQSTSLIMPRTMSRPRSSRSRSRPAPYHPYLSPQHEHESFGFNVNLQPSLSGLSNSILRSTSQSSSSSASSFPTDSPIIVTPSHPTFNNRGRPERPHLARAVQSISRSRSPGEMPATPIDIELAERRRGRKAVPRHIQPSPGQHPFISNDNEALTSPVEREEQSDAVTWLSRWMSPDGVADETVSRARDRSSRSASQDDDAARRRASRRSWMNDHLKSARAESVPPVSGKVSAQRPLSGFSTNAAATPIPLPMSTRSRSAGFDLGRRGERRREQAV